MNLLIGTNENDERYIFSKDGYVTSYFEDFKRGPRGKMSWDESYHFNTGTLLGHIENAQQIDVLGTIGADNMTYYSHGKYFDSKTATFEIGQNGVFKFKDKK